MRLAPEAAVSAVLLAAATAGYLAVARGGVPAASGLVGHGLGVLGLLAMAAGTGGYSWRRKRSGPGSMQRWLQTHVVTGIVGPYLVLLHTGFHFRGLAGVAFLLLAVVVASGFVGRFAYTTVPKMPAGDARRTLAVWWLLHVPLAVAMFALAFVHVAAALYYVTLLR